MEHLTSTFQPEIFKFVWAQTAKKRSKEDSDEADPEVAAAVNSDALKLSCEYLRLFVTEAVERAALVAEAEGCTTIEGTHFERILPQLLLDF
nr:protein MHF2 homolog isoform X4 [Physcomitrium patens]|eukprot:XP_024397179.1 protein MHF2 homolog isoform X4 [Physcomitrella patens]